MKRGPIEDVDLWPVWEQVRCPVLVLRGVESDLLLPQTAEEMNRRGPRAEVVEIDGIGHAPALMAKDQIDIVRDWLIG
jgi:pimeloyl-ACP methyl ester carboxylesterase